MPPVFNGETWVRETYFFQTTKDTRLVSNMTEEQVFTLLAVANKYPTDYTRLALDIHASFSKYFTNIFTSLKTDSQFVKGTLNWLDSG